MGSPELETANTQYEATKGRIDNALETLRNQLMEMQQQDVVLLRQLMHIHSSIQGLTGSRGSYRRSMSSTSLAASFSGHPSQRPHRELVRLQSAPLRQQSSRGGGEEEGSEEEEEEEEEEDLMTQSFSSFSTEPLELSFEMSRLHSCSSNDSLPPIPKSLRRKLIAPIDESPEKETHPDCPPSPNISEALDYPDTFISEIVPKENWSNNEKESKNNNDYNKMRQYEPSYETMLKRSSQLWRDVQREKEEKGTVDHKKMTTLKIFL